MPTKNLYSTEDSFMNYADPNVNYGSSNNIETKNWIAGEENPKRGMLKFNINDLSPHATVSSATLYLYNTWATGNGRILVYRVIPHWEETKVTWNARINSPYAAWTSAGCSDTTSDRSSVLSGDNAAIGGAGWYSWSLDLTEFELVRSNNEGYIITNAANYEKWFYSRHYGTGEYSPYISVTYTLPTSGGKATYLSDYGII